MISENQESAVSNIEYLRNNDINIDDAINLLGDIEMYHETLKDFYSNFDNRIQKIESLKEQKDMANYAIEVHALKSDSKYLGFTKLAEIALEHELKSKDGNYDYVIGNYDLLITEVNKIKPIIVEYINKYVDKI